MIRTVVVDDQPAIRWGLRMVLDLEPDLTIVGEAGRAEQALQVVHELKPDVVVMDVSMDGMDGLAVTAILRERQPDSRVVVLTACDDALTRKRALAAGASSCVGKCERLETLVAAIRQAGLSTDDA